MEGKVKKVRLFYALPPCREIESVYITLKSTLEENERIKWVSPANLHLTLFFLGEVAEEKVPALIELMDDFLQILEPFTLQFDAITGEGGRRGKPSMIWARFKNEMFAGCVQRIQKLASSFCDTGLKFSNPIPHITLARVKSGQVHIPYLKFDCNIFVNGIELWKTIRTGSGVKYEVVAGKYL